MTFRMNQSFRAFLTTGLVAALFFVLSFPLLRATGSRGLAVETCLVYLLLGIVVGKNWNVYPWQIGLVASAPHWLFTAWRFLTTSNPDEETLNLTLYYYLPMLSMISSYVGTYFGRWLAFKRRQRENPPPPPSNG